MKKLLLLFLTSVTVGLYSSGCSQPNQTFPPGYQNPDGDLNNGFPNDQAPPINTGRGTVEGRVVDSRGKGLPNVTLSIGQIQTQTNFSGDYILNSAPSGQQKLILRMGNRQLVLDVDVTADSVVTPNINPIQFANNGTGGSGIANSKIGTFKVDQDLLNQWKAKGIAASGGKIYISVADSSRIFNKGSIIQMDSNTGKNWENIGSSLLGLRYKIDKTVSGIDANGNSLMAVDTKGAIYALESKGKVNIIESSPAKDIAIGGGVVYISNGSQIERTDSSGQNRVAIPNISAVGGIAADSRGSLYVANQQGIKRLDNSINSSNNQANDLVNIPLNNPIDLTIDDKNGFIYVLEKAEIKRFNMSGVLLANFSNGAKLPVGITTDELGNLYVADSGSDSYKESQIIKFSPGSNNIPAFENEAFVNGNNSYGSESYDDGGYSDDSYDDESYY